MDALLQEDALRPCSAVHRATAYEFIERWRCLVIGAGVEHGVSARHQLCKKTFRRWLLHSQLKMRLSRRACKRASTSSSREVVCASRMHRFNKSARASRKEDSSGASYFSFAWWQAVKPNSMACTMSPLIQSWSDAAASRSNCCMVRAPDKERVCEKTWGSEPELTWPATTTHNMTCTGYTPIQAVMMHFFLQAGALRPGGSEPGMVTRSRSWCHPPARPPLVAFWLRESTCGTSPRQLRACRALF